MMRPARGLLAVVGSTLLVSAGLAGCSSDGGDASPTTADSWQVSNCASLNPATTESAPPEGATIEGGVAVAGALDVAPTVGIAAGAAPATSLVTVDLAPGSGTPVPDGAEVTVSYCGVGLATGNVFDSSWARGEPISFPLAGVIPGWSEGIPGMQPGGRRLLIIPAALAYGDNPPTPAIEPGETLVFVVDLLASS
jgi:peptidylprolyl isomerase